MGSEHDVSAVVRLLSVIGALLVADVCAADPNGSQPEGKPPTQTSSVATAEPVAQSSSATSVNTPSGKPNPAANRNSSATSPGNANNSAKRVLVDDTVNDAQLKQILAKGYRPDRQGPGNEVYYCRSEPELGSRFQKKICKTATRILQDELDGQKEAGLLERPSGNRPQN